VREEIGDGLWSISCYNVLLARLEERAFMLRGYLSPMVPVYSVTHVPGCYVEGTKEPRSLAATVESGYKGSARSNIVLPSDASPIERSQALINQKAFLSNRQDRGAVALLFVELSESCETNERSRCHPAWAKSAAASVRLISSAS
jgi:hypothetical protein